MSIETYLKEKLGYVEFNYNSEITKMHQANSVNFSDNTDPFVSNFIDKKSKGCVQVKRTNSYHTLNSNDLHTKALLISS